MSSSWLVLVSRDPYYLPTGERIEAGVSFVQALLNAAYRPPLPRPELEVLATDRPYFHSALANFESVYCPGCAHQLELAWWQEQLDRDFDGDFIAQFSSFKTPCCGIVVDLNLLVYDFPQAFARFALSCYEPSFSELTPTQASSLHQILGCELLQVHARL